MASSPHANGAGGSRIPVPVLNGSPAARTSPLMPSPRLPSPATTRPNNPFAQPQRHASGTPRGFVPRNVFPSDHPAVIASPGAAPTAPLSVSRRRPVADVVHQQGQGRERDASLPPEPTTGLPRLAASPKVDSPGGGHYQKAVKRQPSTPAFNSIPRKPVTDPTSRPRSQSFSSTPPAPPVPLKTERDRVPAHIRVRLRLIHQLGAVLGLDAQTIAGKIDIPGLLARVDAAYEKGHADMGMESTIGSLPTAMTSSDSHERNRDSKTGVLGMFKRMGGGGKGKEPIDDPASFVPRSPVEESTGPAFGVSLHDMPGNAWCTSLIGGQKHELPLVVFTIIEEIYRRGMSQPGIFRLAGDGTRISHLTKVFNMPPLYGDSLSIANEPIHNLTGLVKRYIRDLPEPILDESLFTAFMAFCIDSPDSSALDAPPASPATTIPPRSLETRVTVAQILLRLLPPLHFSLFIYLLAFLGQLPLFPDNRLSVESISIIFGPAMIAARGRGVAGLGPNSANTKTRSGDMSPEAISDVVNNSQTILSWLLAHWGSISEKVLESSDAPLTPDLAIPSPSTTPMTDTMRSTSSDRLLAPFEDKLESPFAAYRRPDSQISPSTTIMPPPLQLTAVRPAKPAQPQPPMADSANSSSTGFSETPTAHTPSRPISPSPSITGIFTRAFGARPASTQEPPHAHQTETEPKKKTKRSNSFTSISSISSMMKLGGGGWLGKGEHKGPNIEAARSLSAEKLTVREPTPGPGMVNPEISNVLGSLHDLLVSKDKQIERDARELALLRHTILDLDERLTKAQKANTSNGDKDPDSTRPELRTPEITITATAPTREQLDQASRHEITELQSQLTTALAALETARLGSRAHEKRILDLEAKLSRADSERGLEVGKLQVALAMEQGKVVAVTEERDEARERLEKIKTTLFAIAQ